MNAKELALDKLNASTKTLGLYLYAVTIGMEFLEIALILMSPVGKLVSEMTLGNIFKNNKGFFSINNALFRKLENPDWLVFKYSIKRIGDLDIRNPYITLERAVKKLGLKDEKGKSVKKLETVILNTPGNTLIEKLNFWENFKVTVNPADSKALDKQMYNRLIDDIQEFIHNQFIINQYSSYYEDIKTLSLGAKEMKIAGQIFGLNKGIKTKADEKQRQIATIERLIYNMKGYSKSDKDLFDGGDLIDIIKLDGNPLYRSHFPEVDPELMMNDEEYRNSQIQQHKINWEWYKNDLSYQDIAILSYENVKQAINIVEAILTVKHINAYFKALVMDKASGLLNFKSRSLANISLLLEQSYDLHDQTKLNKDINNFISDYILEQWFESAGIKIIIPKGNVAYDSKEKEFVLRHDLEVDLSTEWGRATFRLWFEREVVPNLKSSINYKDNKFIQDLRFTPFTRTVSGNTDIILSLPIKMISNDPVLKKLLTDYKVHFNKLQGKNYKLGKVDMSIIDLFTLYTMITTKWKVNEASLVKIFDDIESAKYLDDFRNFESNLDASERTLSIKKDKDDSSIDAITKSKIEPYIIPTDSPYSSNAYKLWHRDRNTGKMRIMYRLSKEVLELILSETEGLRTSDMIGSYKYAETKSPRINFISGYVNGLPTYTESTKIDINGVANDVEIKWDESGYIHHIKFTNGEESGYATKEQLKEIIGYRTTRDELRNIKDQKERDAKIDEISKHNEHNKEELFPVLDGKLVLNLDRISERIQQTMLPKC